MHKTYPFAAVLRALGFTPTKERDKSSPGVYGRLNGYTSSPQKTDECGNERNRSSSGSVSRKLSADRARLTDL